MSKIVYAIFGVIIVVGTAMAIIAPANDSEKVTIDDACAAREVYIAACEEKGYDVEFVSHPYYYAGDDTTYYVSAEYYNPATGAHSREQVRLDTTF